MYPIAKPDVLFDRVVEWSELTSFATNPTPGATLAILCGRRRQGKTLMLELLAEAREGFLFSGLEQSSAQNLAAMSEAYRGFTSTPVPVAFAGWDQVVDALLALGERERPLPVIVDELPHLLRTAPEITSIIQRALSPRGRSRQRSRARLVLCGSSLTVMSRPLGGTAALRGRASREMMVHPFGFRESARFWDVAAHPDLAFRLHSLLGGTPAYRDFCEGDQPRVVAELHGPHFEDLAREWAMRHASPDTLGGTADQVGRTEINCTEHRHRHELDVVPVERTPNSGERVLAIGEAKWRSEPVGLGELARLRHVREVMNQPAARLLIFSRAGFDPDLVTQAHRARDIELVGIDRLYSAWIHRFAASELGSRCTGAKAPLWIGGSTLRRVGD
jgi:hypothetical protein